MIELLLLFIVSILFTIISYIHDYKKTPLTEIKGFIDKYIYRYIPILPSLITWIINNFFDFMKEISKINKSLYDLSIKNENYSKSMVIFEISYIVLFIGLLFVYILIKEMFSLTTNVHDNYTKYSFLMLLIGYIIMYTLLLIFKKRLDVKKKIDRVTYIIYILVSILLIFSALILVLVDTSKNNIDMVTEVDSLTEYVMNRILPYLNTLLFILKIIGIQKFTVFVMFIYDALKKSKYDTNRSKKKNIMYALCVIVHLIMYYIFKILF